MRILMTKKTKLLVSGDYPLIASPTLAQAYGVPSAMFLQKLHYCLQSSDAKCIQQQKYFYHSYEQWAETLGIYSVSTIKRIVSKLKNAGILIVKKLAQNKWLQTNFYSINYRKLSALLKHTADLSENEVMDQAQSKTTTLSPEMPKQHSTRAIKITTPLAAKAHVKDTLNIEGLSQPLHSIAYGSNLESMPPEKRELYHHLLKLKVDIHYDDVRLDEWLVRRNFIIQKAAFLKDQLGHRKILWYSPEQLGLTLA